MRPVSITKALTAGSATCIAQGQSVAAGANAVLNGGSVTSVPNGKFGADVSQAVLDTQRRVIVVSAGNDSANSVHLYGLSGGGQAINEVLDLTNAGTAVSALDYANLQVAQFASATAGTITIGTNGTGSTDWIVPNYHLTPFEVGINAVGAAGVTYNVEGTMTRDFWAPPAKNAASPQPVIVAIRNGATLTDTENLTTPLTGIRFTITAGQGTLTADVVQAGIANY